MIHNATHDSLSKALTTRITEAEQEFDELLNSLPPDVTPNPFMGFDISEPPENTETLLGWSYDWSDRGGDPPPWSDWSDKEG